MYIDNKITIYLLVPLLCLFMFICSVFVLIVCVQSSTAVAFTVESGGVETEVEWSGVEWRRRKQGERGNR